MLQRSQIPFTLIDHEGLASAHVQPDGRLAIRDHVFESVVLPQDTELPPPAAEVLRRFSDRGGRTVVDRAETPGTGESLVAALRPAYGLSPPSDRIVLGRFSRDGREILLVVNVAADAYEGHLVAGGQTTWQCMDPASGTIQPAQHGEAGRIRLELAARQAILLAQSQ
jgi:hypothetical protein